MHTIMDISKLVYFVNQIAVSVMVCVWGGGGGKKPMQG